MPKLLKFSCSLLLVVMPFLAAGSAMAADGSSGCGPGWYVFKENTLVSSSLRSTTNAFLFPSVSFGMTSGTSNCSKHGIVLDGKKGLHFATLAMQDLETQMAQGQGEHLSAFAATLGCPWQVQEAFNNTMQKSYDQLFPTSDTTPEALLKNVIERMSLDSTLSTTCSMQMG